MKPAIWAFLIVGAFVSCEKTINITPQQRDPVLVVDGQIEEGQAPLIILSKSINYFNSISPDILSASVVRNAQLTLSNGTRTVPLKEFVLQLTPDYSLSYYSIDSTSIFNQMVGEQEKTYTLTILTEGKTYTSVTSIPKLTKKVDSLWWERIPRADDTTRVWLMAKVTDPPGLGNYVRYFTKANRGNFKPGENSVHDDQVVDGTSYEVQVEQGKDRVNPEDHRRSFAQGDTVTVKFSNIDKGTFHFWRTLEFAYGSVGNPFSSPIKVLGNVNNGALGAFCGYSSQYTTLIIPK